jgi:hypothetical protein
VGIYDEFTLTVRAALVYTWLEGKKYGFSKQCAAAASSLSKPIIILRDAVDTR